jgi:chromosome segregation ATPase
LAQLLGLPSPRPAWIEPMVHTRQTLGVFIVGKRVDEPDWPQDVLQTIQAYATYLSSALHTARHFQDVDRHNEELSRRLADLESQSARSKADAQAALGACQAELEQVKVELYATRQQIAQHRRREDDLVALVQLQNELVQQAQQSQPEADRWSTQQLSDLLRQRRELEDRIQVLEQALAEARPDTAAPQDQSE